jgi:hypothetical protein
MHAKGHFNTMKAIFFMLLGALLYWAYEHPQTAKLWSDYLSGQMNQVAVGKKTL